MFCERINGLLFTGRHFGIESAVRNVVGAGNLPYFKCEATANSITGHICVNSNKRKASALQIEML